jgi:hypothetical protein
MVSKYNLNIIANNNFREIEILNETLNIFHSSISKNCKFELLSDLISPIVVLKYFEDEKTKSIFYLLKANGIGTLLTNIKGKGLAIKFYLNSKINESDIGKLVKILNKES